MLYSLRLAAALFAMSVTTVAVAATNLGDFETPGSQMAGWQMFTSTESDEHSDIGEAWFVPSADVLAPPGTGNNVAFLHTGSLGIYQRLWRTVDAGPTGGTLSALTRFKSEFSGAGYEDDAYMAIGALDEADTVTSWSVLRDWNSLDDGDVILWETLSTTLASGRYRLEFGIRNVGDDDDWSPSELFIDNVAFAANPAAPVPEPGEWAMIVAGLGVVGFAARRRKLA